MLSALCTKGSLLVGIGIADSYNISKSYPWYRSPSQFQVQLEADFIAKGVCLDLKNEERINIQIDTVRTDIIHCHYSTLKQHFGVIPRVL